MPWAPGQLRLVPIPDVSDSLDRYQFDLRAARVGGIESTWVSHCGVHMTGRAATATGSPGHEKSCPRPVQRLHPIARKREQQRAANAASLAFGILGERSAASQLDHQSPDQVGGRRQLNHTVKPKGTNVIESAATAEPMATAASISI
jgi:hypothetical protein